MQAWGIGQILFYEALIYLALLVILRSRRAALAWRARRRPTARPDAGPSPQPLAGPAVEISAPETPSAPLAAEPPAPRPAEPQAARPLARVRREAVDPALTAAELLAAGEAYAAAGGHDAAGAHYRAAIRSAQKEKQPALEARARLALGDIARAGGDLTSACEHWQMARVLFSGCGAQDDTASVITRMERAGCPTDWVLNEF